MKHKDLDSTDDMTNVEDFAKQMRRDSIVAHIRFALIIVALLAIVGTGIVALAEICLELVAIIVGA